MERETLEESQCRMLRRRNAQKQAIKNVHYNEKLFFEDCEIEKSVHAELNTTMSEMYDITKLIEGSISVVEYFYQKKFDRRQPRRYQNCPTA